MSYRNTVAAVLLLVVVTTAGATPRPSQIRDVTNDPGRVVDLRRVSSDTREFAQSVAQALWLVAAGRESEPARRVRTAEIVAAAIAAAGEDSEAFAALLAERVSVEMLPVVAAAAVLVSGDRSPGMLEALILGAGGSIEVREALTGAAQQPVAVLGRRTALALAPAPTDSTFVAFSPITLSNEPAEPLAQDALQPTGFGDDDPQPIPLGGGDDPPPWPRPPAMPPRPPAMPYRGQ